MKTLSDVVAVYKGTMTLNRVDIQQKLAHSVESS